MKELPAGWLRAPIGRLADVIAGQAPPGHTYNSGGIGLPLYQGKTDFGDLHLKAPRVWTTAASKVAEQGDVLLSVRAPVGPTNLATARCAIGRGLAAVRGLGGMNQKFLLYALRATEYALADNATGTTFSAITGTVIRNHAIPVAPIAEQERIVAALEEQFSRVDAGVAMLKDVRRNLKRLRGGILESAVSSPGPSGTPLVALCELLAPGRRIAYGVLVPGDDVATGVQLVRVGDLKNRTVTVGGLKRIDPAVAGRYPRTSLQGGEVLLSLVGTIGRTAVVPPELKGSNAARALAVIPVRADVSARYVSAVLSRDRVTRDLTALSHEVARKTLNLEDVRRYQIPLPDYATQKTIIDQVEYAEAWIALVEDSISSAIRRAAVMRRALLAAAFSGRLVPQSPNDAPASALLDRISAARTPSTVRSRRAARKSRTPRQKVSA